VESIIKQPPDVVMKLREAQRVQTALAGAPGSLRIVDEKTLYFRPPPGYLEPEVLLMVLRNLMYNAYQRELKGESEPAPKPAPAPVPVEGKKPAAQQVAPVQAAPAPAGPKPQLAKPLPAKPAAKTRDVGALVPELEKLVALRQQGILSEEEFESAKTRLVAKANAMRR
jgi:hypothetical protein